MPEDNGQAGVAQPVTEQPQQQQAAAPEPFSAHQAVEDLFASLNRSPRPETAQQSIPSKDDTAKNDVLGQQATTPSVPAVPSAEKAVNWEKRYNDLQSDIDRRNNKVEEKLRAEFQGQVQQLAQALILSRQQQQPSTQQADEGYDQPLTRKEAQAIMAQETARIRQELSADPRLQVAGHIADYARFQDEKQDYRKYEPFFKKFVEKFPLAPGESLHNKLSSFYDFMADLEAEAQAQANRAGGAVNNNQTPPPQQAVHPNQADQAAALQERAQRYRMEQGVNTTAATRPAIDTFGNEEEAINAIVNSVMRGNRR